MRPKSVGFLWFRVGKTLIDPQKGALYRYSLRLSDLTAWSESFAREQPTTKCLDYMMLPIR
jgi:hypothetical protein